VRIVVAHSQLHAFGGGERCTLELLSRLSSRHDVELWAGGYVPDATYEELRLFPRRDLRPAEWLSAVPKADAVIAHTFGAYLLALRHPRVVSYVHTLRSRYLLGGARPDLLARRALDRVALHRSAALATNSEYTAARASRRYQRPCHVVPPGADDALFALPPRVGHYALYVGRLAPEKGVEQLIRWTAQLPLDLRITGDGDPRYVAYLRALAGPQVRFLGPLTGASLLDAYADCRFLMFLPHEEEFGMAALEAMAAAKPVIGTAEGALPALIRRGESGILVRTQAECVAAAARLLGDEALCLRLGQQGRQAAHSYRWARYVEQIEQLCLGLGA
jgi:glycosyltransferase involved in cell wall biosynthesis